MKQKRKFYSIFSKKSQFPKAAPLVVLRRARNTPLKERSKGEELRQRFRWGSEHDRSPFFMARVNVNIPDVPVARRGRSKLFFQAKPSTKSSPFFVQNVPPERFEALSFRASFKREGQSCLSLPRNAVAFLTHSPRFFKKAFAVCGQRPKALPLDSAIF